MELIITKINRTIYFTFSYFLPKKFEFATLDRCFSFYLYALAYLATKISNYYKTLKKRGPEGQHKQSVP